VFGSLSVKFDPDVLDNSNWVLIWSGISLRLRTDEFPPLKCLPLFARLVSSGL
jgi:hypothetical protein